MFDSMRNTELCAGLSQSRTVLCGRIYGNIEDGCCLDQLLGGENAGQLSDSALAETSSTHTFSYSQIAGRNFSWMSQILSLGELAIIIVLLAHIQ